MASYNRIIMIGNLTRDPDYKQQQSGQGLCKLSIASNRQFRNKQTGLLVQEVCYVDVEVWGPQADNCRQYLQKGRPVLVEGRLKLDTWEAEGQTRRRHAIVAERVVFLGSNQQAEGVTDESGITPSQAAPAKGASMKSKDKDTSSDDTVPDAVFKDAFEDDLPF